MKDQQSPHVSLHDFSWEILVHLDELRVVLFNKIVTLFIVVDDVMVVWIHPFTVVDVRLFLGVYPILLVYCTKYVRRKEGCVIQDDDVDV